jgi:hypothetical protein
VPPAGVHPLPPVTTIASSSSGRPVTNTADSGQLYPRVLGHGGGHPIFIGTEKPFSLLRGGGSVDVDCVASGDVRIAYSVGQELPQVAKRNLTD